jgi:hypothetical protein
MISSISQIASILFVGMASYLMVKRSGLVGPAICREFTSALHLSYKCNSLYMLVSTDPYPSAMRKAIIRTQPGNTNCFCKRLYTGLFQGTLIEFEFYMLEILLNYTWLDLTGDPDRERGKSPVAT